MIVVVIREMRFQIGTGSYAQEEYWLC